jgi:hypothetical protein
MSCSSLRARPTCWRSSRTGVADDMLTTAALATEAPLVLAPAMNTHMWRDEATQANLAVLRERGADRGRARCGRAGLRRRGGGTPGRDGRDRRSGPGRTRTGPGPEGVRLARDGGADVRAHRPGSLHRQPLLGQDRLRDRRGGRTARRRGDTRLRADLVARSLRVYVVRVQTAEEMHRAAMDAFASADAVIATAAVSDLRPAESERAKLKKSMRRTRWRSSAPGHPRRDGGAEGGARAHRLRRRVMHDLITEARAQAGAQASRSRRGQRHHHRPGLGFGSRQQPRLPRR